MKVLLIGPTMFYNKSVPLYVNQALFVLYSYLRRKCPQLQVQYLNLPHELNQPSNAQQYATWLEECEVLLARQDWDMVGISCWCTLNYTCSVAVARICKKLNPEAPVIVGGYHATYLSHEFDLPDKPFDYVVKGDGEEALRRIVMGEVPRETTPQIVQGMPVPIEEHVVLWEESPYVRTYETMHVWFSRGCPFSCGYCLDRRTTWRALPPEVAVAELKRLRREVPHVRSILVCDPLFGIQKPWRDDFLARLKGADLDWGYWVQSRVDIIDRDMIDAVAGMHIRVDVGLESVVPEMLAIMKKTNDPARYLRAFREVTDYMNERQVPHGINQIYNYPGETNRSLDASLAFWDRYYQERDEYYSLLNVWPFQYYPGCDAWDNWQGFEEQFGTRVMDPYWWHAPDWGNEDVAAMLIASRELAESRSTGRVKQVMSALHRLTRTKVKGQAFARILEPNPPIAIPSFFLLTTRMEAYFDDKRMHLHDKATALTKVNGNLLLYNYASEGYYNCSPETSRLLHDVLEGGMTLDDVIARDADIYPDAGPRRQKLRMLFLELINNGFLSPGYAPPPAYQGEDGPAPRVLLRTGAGEIELELFPDEAPELVANFLQLVRARYYDSLKFLNPEPVDVLDLGAYSLFDNGPGYRLPPQVTGLPFTRGAVAQYSEGHYLHGARVWLARSDRMAGKPQAVFGRIVRGWEPLDRLVAWDEVLRAEVLTGRDDGAEAPADRAQALR